MTVAWLFDDKGSRKRCLLSSHEDLECLDNLHKGYTFVCFPFLGSFDVLNKDNELVFPALEVDPCLLCFAPSHSWCCF